MSTGHDRRIAARGGWYSLARDRRGATMLEFAVVGPVFIVLICMVMQMGLQTLAQWSLDLGVRHAARQIQIGNIWDNGQNPQATFVADVCNNAPFALANCNSTIQVYVTWSSYDSTKSPGSTGFSALTPATVNSSGVLTPSTFSAPVSGADVLVQVAYKMNYLNSLLSNITGGSSFVLLSTMAVQNMNYAE